MIEAPDLRGRLSAAARGSVIATLSAMGASFVSQVWLARRFGPIGLGDYNATGLFATVLTTLLLLGIPAAISGHVAALSEARDEREGRAVSGALTIMLALGGVALIVAAILWQPFAAVAHLAGPAAVPLVAGAALGAVLQSFVISVLLARLQLALATAVVLTQPAAVAVGLALSYVIDGMGGSSLATIGFLSGGLASTVVLFAHQIRPRAAGEEVRTIGIRTLPGTTMLYLTQLSSWLDRLIVVLITGPAGLGAFAVASFLVEAVLRVPRNAGFFGVAAYARLAEDRVGARRVLDSQIRIMSAFFIVAAAGLVTAGNGLLGVIFGAGFEVATTTLRLLAVGLVPGGIALALVASAVGTDRHHRLTLLLGILVPLQITLATLGATRLGIAGVALAELVLWSLATAVLYTGTEEHGVRPASGTLFVVVAVAAPVLASALLISELLPVHWIVKGSLSAAVSIPSVLLILVGVPERRILRRLSGQFREAAG